MLKKLSAALLFAIITTTVMSCAKKQVPFTGLSDVGGGDGSGDSINTYLYQNYPPRK